MIVPHLHFCGNCEEAIALYEKAFHTKAENVVRNSDYSPDDCKGDNRIAHATMKIQGHTVFLNDNETMFSMRDISLNFPVHIIVYFQTAEELLECYEILKGDSPGRSPFVETSYSALTGNFKDKFGMLWGFMIS